MSGRGRARALVVVAVIGAGAGPALARPRPGRTRPSEPLRPAPAAGAPGERDVVEPGVAAPDASGAAAAPSRRSAGVARGPARPASAELSAAARAAGVDAGEAPRFAAPAPLRVEVAGALVGRRFAFDAPLQRESALARPGFRIGVEGFARGLLPGALGHLGLAGSFARETGNAELGRSDGSFVRRAVWQRRWWVDAQYAVELSPALWLYPRLGVGNWYYEASGSDRRPPSQCRDSHPDICLPRVDLTHARLGASARAAPTRRLGFDGSLIGLVGLALDGHPGGLAAESRVRSYGFAADLGASWALSSWFALRVAAEVGQALHDFTAATVGYARADELYYGAHLAAVLRMGG